MPEDCLYFDHSATTPVAPEVVEAMLPYFGEIYGNASGAYRLGRRARCALESARRQVADVLGCAPDEIVFTSGGSESDNLALRGVARQARAEGRGRHLITTAIEHGAVRATMDDLAGEGFEVTQLGVDAEGRVEPDQVLSALRDDTLLVSVMLANNEVGTLQPVAEIGRRMRGHGALLHTDAVQAAAYVDLSVDALGVDLMSLSAHKFYGPKGVGALYHRRRAPLCAVQTGGGQEGRLRAGTENVAGAVGLAVALRLSAEHRAEESARLRALRERLVEGLCALDGVRLTGHPRERLPGHASFCVGGVSADVLLLGLDMRGIAASSGSACSAGKVDPSPVLLAMGISEEDATGALRFSMGRGTTPEQVERVIEVMTGLVTRGRRVVLAA